MFVFSPIEGLRFNFGCVCVYVCVYLKNRQKPIKKERKTSRVKRKKWKRWKIIEFVLLLKCGWKRRLCRDRKRTGRVVGIGDK